MDNSTALAPRKAEQIADDILTRMADTIRCERLQKYGLESATAETDKAALRQYQLYREAMVATLTEPLPIPVRKAKLLALAAGYHKSLLQLAELADRQREGKVLAPLGARWPARLLICAQFPLQLARSVLLDIVMPAMQSRPRPSRQIHHGRSDHEIPCPSKDETQEKI